jgi:hypothetical protein
VDYTYQSKVLITECEAFKAIKVGAVKTRGNLVLPTQSDDDN